MTIFLLLRLRPVFLRKMMLLPVACISMLPAFLSAQSTAVGSETESVIQVVSLPLEWEIGEKQHWEIRKKRTDFKWQRQVSKQQAVLPFTVELLERDALGYRIAWTYGMAELEIAPAEQHAFLRDFMKLNEGLRLEIQTDTEFIDLVLRNTDEVVTHYEKVAARLKKFLQSSEFSPEHLEKVNQVLEPLMKRENVARTIMTDPELFFYYFGGSYALDFDEEFPDVLPNPFGGPLLPATVRVRVKEYDSHNNELVILWNQSLDSEKAGRILQESFKRLLKMGDLAQENNASVELEIQDRHLYRMNTVTGWPYAIESTRTAHSNQWKRVEEKRFMRAEQKEVEKPSGKSLQEPSPEESVR